MTGRTIYFTPEQLDSVWREYGALVEACDIGDQVGEPRGDAELVRGIYDKVSKARRIATNAETVEEWRARQYRRLDRVLQRRR